MADDWIKRFLVIGLVQQLNILYQTVSIVLGALIDAAAKKYDLEGSQLQGQNQPRALQPSMGSPRSPSPSAPQVNVVQQATPSTVANVDAGEPNTHNIAKSIHELVSQIDPSEKLDPEVED